MFIKGERYVENWRGWRRGSNLDRSAASTGRQKQGQTASAKESSHSDPFQGSLRK